MPTQHVEPEVAFQVTNSEGKTWIIYHTYKDNNFNGGRESFWYTADITEREEYEFDIRDIIFGVPGIMDSLTPLQRSGANADRLVLQLALDKGAVRFKDERLVVRKRLMKLLCKREEEKHHV